MGRYYKVSASETGILKTKKLFLSYFQSLFGCLLHFNTILEHSTVCFRVHFILKNMEVIFLNNISSYVALHQFFVIELALVRIPDVHRSKSAHQEIFLEVSDGQGRIYSQKNATTSSQSFQDF